ncbi:MAG: GDSL-type esterase/lipase family protein [Candidatus Pacearchaeota archaeon]|nr:GDSL-type esterase/lipase family protein [Candidatus Pacearchaeota archaeon]
MDKTICIFGASSVWGAWDYEKSGWANRLRLFLDSENYDIFTYTLGVSGDTTNELLKRFDIEAEARQPTLIIFSIGDNDSIYVKSQNKQMVSPQQFEKNLQKLIDKAKKFTDVIIFIGCKKVDEPKTTPIPWATDYHYTNQNLSLYNQKIKDISNKNKIHYLEISDLIKNEDFEDGLHLNSKGHQKLFLKIKDFLLDKKLL